MIAPTLLMVLLVAAHLTSGAACAAAEKRKEAAPPKVPQPTGGLIAYLGTLRPGAAYSGINGALDINYEPTRDDQAGPGSSQCAKSPCKVGLKYENSSSFGIILRPPLRVRTHWFNYGLDFRSGVRLFNASYGGAGTSPSEPVQSASARLIGINLDGVGFFGFVPPRPWPAMQFSAGMGLQPLFGTISVNGNRKSNMFINFRNSVEAELFVWRPAWGEFSLFALADTEASRTGGKDVTGEVNLKTFEFARSELGFAYLARW